MFVDVPDGVSSTRMIATPCDFEGTPWEASYVAPGLGEHTENVLMEIGFTEDQIRQLTAE